MNRGSMPESFDYIIGQLKNGYIDLGFHDEDELELVEQAIQKQIPKKPIRMHDVYPKHDWKLDEYGEIDL